jgi:hypothetical protein
MHFRRLAFIFAVQPARNTRPWQDFSKNSNRVPYTMAAWLIYHTFDPRPFPNLMAILDREDVDRPPAVEIPFACPAGNQLTRHTQLADLLQVFSQMVYSY